MALLAASWTAGITLAVTHGPPEIGPRGKLVSPNTTSMRSFGKPVRSATTFDRTVYVPVPISCVAHDTLAVPFDKSSTVACASQLSASHEHPATPRPKVNPLCSPVPFIEPTAGVYRDHP